VRKIRRLAALLAVTATTVFGTATAASASPLKTTDLIAFVRGGNLFVAAGDSAPTQITTGGGYAWPRWAGAQRLGLIAYTHNGDVFVSTFSSRFGLTGTIQLSSGAHAGAPSFSPSGLKVAFLDGTSTSGVLYIADISTTPPTITPVVGAANAARQPQTVVRQHQTAVTPSLVGQFSPLINSAAVAWSPNGTYIAFPGGDCLGIFDHCLSLLNLNTNEQTTVAAFSGGGDVREGYATVPAWSSDSKNLYWTQQNTDPLINNGNTISPLRIFKYRVGTQTAPNQWGRDGDSEIAPFSAGGVRFLLTVPVGNKAWIAESEGGVRTLLYPGYESNWVLN